jgi:putative membrane-bound dehydrogenase-like protein
MTSTATYSLLAGGIAAAFLSALVRSGASQDASILNRATSAGASQRLTVPPDFEVERVAGPPLVDRPIVADFDEEGRLYVADSSGSNDKVDKQVVERPHRIVRLEDTNGDGRFDKSVVFADRMMLPEGTMWLDGSLYVAAPPSIWKLTDTDGDGVADRREEWFQGKTLTGCANDLHGPYLGPDGWIYWTKGAFAEQTYDRGTKPPLVSKAAHVFRRRPGDSAIEAVLTGGMDNPVDVAFTATGERIVTSTFLEHPQTGRRDGVIHAVYGGLYGKPHAVIDAHKRTGELMPVMLQLGPAVPAGLTRYASGAFGEDYRDGFFAALFNLHKVIRLQLDPDGATFKARESDFVVSNSRDFFPTDVIEDADGSLLVVDTGPWYTLCCPSSQLAKPEVLGGIYRVRRRGARRPEDPRGLRIGWNALAPAEAAARLDDLKPAVRNRAIQRLGKQGGDAVSALEDVLKRSSSPEARRNAVWALTRIESTPARQAVRLALRDRDESVRHAAIHSAGLWRDADAVPQLVDALKSNARQLQRAAAEALGRTGNSHVVGDLIAAASSSPDRVLEHSLIYAAIEIDDPRATFAALKQAGPTSSSSSTSSRGTRAALIALDQMDPTAPGDERAGNRVTPEMLMPLLDSSDPVLKETAWWIAERHLEWGGALSGFFQRRLADPKLGQAEREDLQQKLVRFATHPAIQELLAAAVARDGAPNERLAALKAMAAAATGASAAPKAQVKGLPAPWIAPIVGALGSRDHDVTRHAITVVRASPASIETPSELKAALLDVARDSTRPLDVRVDALGSVQPGLSSVEPDLFELLRGGLAPDQVLAIRATAAGTIERATFNRAQLLALTESLKTIGPLELPRVLRAFDNGNDEALGLAIVASVERSTARSSVRAEVLRLRLSKYPPSVQAAGEAFLSSVNLDSAIQAKRLDEVLATLQGGDVRRGQTVFNSPKAACLSCHTIGYQGGKLGPELTRIGQMRSERDLLEAILFPSASFARGYEPVIVTTKSGRTLSGVLRGDLAAEVVLGTIEREETRIGRQEIVSMEPSTVSLMPPGLEQQLTKQELADLLAFLKAARPRSN